jgi:hypothetical protein
MGGLLLSAALFIAVCVRSDSGEPDAPARPRRPEARAVAPAPEPSRLERFDPPEREVTRAAPPDAGPAQAAESPEPGLTLDDWLGQNGADAAKNIDEYCALAKSLADTPDLLSGRDRDASSYLAVRVDWDDPQRPPGLLHLPEALRQRIISYGPAWPAAITDADLADVDLSWMSELHKFDHWDLLADGPLRERRDHDFETAPLPKFGELRFWARLRLARALRDGDLSAASADIHQLAALMRSTETFPGGFTSNGVLELERAAFAAAAAAGRHVPEGLAASEADLAAEKRLGRASIYFFLPGVPAQLMERAATCNPRLRCPALLNGLAMRVQMTGEAGPLPALIAAQDCSADLARWISTAPRRSQSQWLQDLGPPGALNRVFIPPAE